MSKTIEQLRAQAAQIEEATRQGENTQIRVGGLFTDVIDFIAQIPITETVLGPLLQALNNSGLLEPSDGQTLTFSIRKDGWTYSDALTQLKLSQQGIEQTVTSNYEAFISVKNQLQREVAATDQRVRNYKTDYDNSQIEYATWKVQTDTQISQYAVAIDKNTNQIISISGRVDTAYDQLDFVTNDLQGMHTAMDTINNETIPSIRTDLGIVADSAANSATWISKNKDQIAIIAASFDEHGNLINTSGLVTESNYAAMFSQAMVDNKVVTRAEIATFVTQDEMGNFVSHAVIQADQINMTGTKFEAWLHQFKVEASDVIGLTANNIDFHFTDGWSVYYGSTDDNKVMWLDNNGDLHITGTFYGQFPDGVKIGSKTNKRMWIEDTEYNGTRLIGKNGNKETILLGFDNKYPTDQYGVLKLGYVEENSYAELHTHYFHIQYGTRWVSLWAETGIEIVNQGTFRIGLYGGDAGSRVRIMADYARWPKRKQDVEIGEVYIDGNNNLKVNDGLG